MKSFECLAKEFGFDIFENFGEQLKGFKQREV